MVKISIIIPVYNEEKHIGRCLDSIIDNNYKDIEVIVVDDGSVDDTHKVVDKYIKKYDYIKYVYQENGRQGKARNNGLKKATGDYVYFLDGDDYISKDLFKDINNNLEKYNSDIVLFDYYLVTGEKKELVKSFTDVNDINNITTKEYMLCSPSPCNKVIKKSLLLDNDLFFKEKMIYEDYCLIPQLAIYNPKISYIEKGYFFYVKDDISTTRSNEYRENYKDLITATEILYDNCKNKGLDEELEYVVIYHLLHEGSLLFFKYNKDDKLDIISDFMKKNFPNYKKNKYYRKQSKKFKIMCDLFYNKKYDIIRKTQKIKRRVFK